MNRGYSLSKNSQANVDTCAPIIKRLVERAMEIANTRKLHCPDWGVSSGKRTTDEQFNMYRKGRSMVIKDKGSSEYAVVDPSKVVTNADGYTNKSAHQTGLAFDIYCYVDGKTNYDFDNLAAVATCLFAAASDLEEQLVWGGNWISLTDAPHFEVKI